ncbi:MAG: hypothetical protein Ct9H300mP22_1610 [Gammaproteobacteria bacterium]|nr:MAG: hypothetical protein Ct9H300mP22_1610 [Gammaproteobacteria bacterium]
MNVRSIRTKLERCLCYRPSYWIKRNRETKDEESDTRRKLVGSGDRSEKNRTYNYPQGRVTDHRINLTLYNLPGKHAGNLGSVIQPLINEYQADLLAGLAEED